MTEYLTVREVADTLGITPRRVQQLIQAGRLEARLTGNLYLIRPDALAAVMDKRPGKPKATTHELTYTNED